MLTLSLVMLSRLVNIRLGPHLHVGVGVVTVLYAPSAANPRAKRLVPLRCILRPRQRFD